MLTRRRILLDPGWKFHLGDLPFARPREAWQGPWAVSGMWRGGGAGRQLDDSGWRDVDLPHDFVVEREFLDPDAPPEFGTGISNIWNGSRPAGVAWYRRHLTVPASDLGRRLYLCFDGVFRDSTVYLNEFYVGHHVSGYSSFFYDVTDLVSYGGQNVIAIRVDATQNEGWWYEGGGIYRHVWLVVVEPVHVALWGTFVTSQLDLSGPTPRARLEIRTTVANKAPAAAECLVCLRVIDPTGAPVGEAEAPLGLPAWDQAEAHQTLAVDPAALWSVEEPQLYSLETEIRVAGQVVDTYETLFGIRSIRFDADRGFFLNERPVKIQGVCCHQDHAGVGVAVPDALIEFRIRKLKEMGCNAYRSAHHPATPELLDICDHLGMLVMDENRLLSSSDENRGQLESMIRRDRNHPSVVLWSLGNEEDFIQWDPPSALIARSLVGLAHKLDPTRPVTQGINFVRAATLWPVTFEELPLSDMPRPAAELDVMGFNYAPHNWQPYHDMRPQQPSVVSEASSNLRTRGCYVTEPEQGHVAWEGSSQSGYGDAEGQWAMVAANRYLSGIFVWTGFDYRGEPWPNNRWPAVSSNFGIMDTCGFPKDSYYYYRANWRPEPLVHVFPHWTWPGRHGQPMTINAYGNCEEVELFLNGRSLGRKKQEPSRHLTWPGVIYEPGLLEARGYQAGHLVAVDRVETTSAPCAIRLAPDRERIRADGRDLTVVDVAVVDDQDRVVPMADHEITFRVEGRGKIIGVGNGNPSSHEPDKASRRRAFNGLCQVILQCTGGPGEIILSAHSPALLPARITITTSDD